MLLSNRGILDLIGVDSFNKVKPFLTKRDISYNGWDSLINYLLKEGIIKDEFVLTRDTNRKIYWYKDKLFLKYKIGYRYDSGLYTFKSNFLFDSIKTLKKLNITKEEHDKNIKNYNIDDISINDCVDTERQIFIKDPFSDYTNNSKYIYYYIKWNYRLDPFLLMSEILKYNKIGKICSICGKLYNHKYMTSDICIKCNKNLEFIKPPKINFNQKDLLDCLLNGNCPICGKFYKNISRHVFRKHRISLTDFIYENYKTNDKCICGERLQTFTTIQKMIRYNKNLENMFDDFDMKQDFLIYKHTCSNRKCSASNTYVKFKKIYPNKDIKKYFQDIINIITKKYYNIENYKGIINGLLNSVREMSIIKEVIYNDYKFMVYSKYEEYWIKKLIDEWTPDILYTNWDITMYLYDFIYYENDKTKRYVPDLYIKKNNKEYLYEFKSLWTFGFDLKKNILIDRVKMFNALSKIKYCDEYCQNNNIKFIIIIDDYIFSYKELINNIKKRFEKGVINEFK